MLTAGVVVGSATNALAQATVPTCASLVPAGSTAVNLAGSTAVQPVLQTLAKTFASANPPVNISMLYYSLGSCAGLADLLGSQAVMTNGNYIGPDGHLTSCSPPMTVGASVDLAVADVFASTCLSTGQITAAPGTGFKDFLGPIQVMTMVTRKESSQVSISADAAYTIFGFAGQTYKVMPWVDPTQMFIRSPSSGTINMIGTAIGLPAPKWLVGTMYDAQREKNSGAVLAALQSATMVDPTIGIVAADFADQFRNPAAPPDGGTAPPGIKVLAYKHTGQSCGYLPDSDATHFDKINVRQGRYAIWGPVHMTAPVDGQGNATNASVATILQYFSSVGPSPDATLTTTQKQAMIDAEADAFTVPWCAMQVQRDGEITPPKSFAPKEPCGCYYEKHKGSPVTTSCMACPNGDGDCSGATPKCRYGFCEAR
jgi:hypothetical protein